MGDGVEPSQALHGRLHRAGVDVLEEGVHVRVEGGHGAGVDGHGAGQLLPEVHHVVAHLRQIRRQGAVQQALTVDLVEVDEDEAVVLEIKKKF